ncbi:MAG: universal stress protein [Vulcanimicrobiota bacterium]
MSAQRLLVPLDGSELADCALPWAILMAGLKGCELELLRCFEPPEEIFVVTDFLQPASDMTPTEVIRAKIESYLAAKNAELQPLVAVTSCLEGDPATRILERVEDPSIEMVVMASHGRSGLGRWLLGSVSTKVSRGLGSTPILIVKATEKRRQPRLKRLLVPLDGSQRAEAALSVAADLASKSGASLHLYQNVRITPLGHPELDGSVQLELALAKTYLDQIKRRFPHLKITTQAQISELKSGIVAQGEECDLIVMCSHGRSGAKRWLLGSIAESVLQKTTRPVLLIRPE